MAPRTSTPNPYTQRPYQPQPLALKPSRRAACAHHPTVDYAPGSGFSWGLFLKASSRLWVDCPDVAGARTGCAVRKLSWLAQQIAQNVASRHIDRMPSATWIGRNLPWNRICILQIRVLIDRNHYDHWSLAGPGCWQQALSPPRALDTAASERHAGAAATETALVALPA
jgi:hypothetical protein